MQEGWEVFASDKPDVDSSWKDYDFILLDYSMPKRTGLDVLKALKEQDVNVPVIFLTGHGNEIIASEAIKQGAFDYVVKDTQLLYLERLPNVLREAKSKYELIETNRFLIQELRRANERLQTESYTDEMTGIHNYRFMRRQIEVEIQRAIRYEKPMSLCLIDIDHFKDINDRFGHPAGDLVLKELARILKDATRTVDYVGRYAGDEFLILFPNTELGAAVRLAERIRSMVADHPFVSEGQTIHVSLCVGVTDFDPKKRNTSESLIVAADKCLYQAKKDGRNRVHSKLRLISSESNKRDAAASAQQA